MVFGIEDNVIPGGGMVSHLVIVAVNFSNAGLDILMAKVEKIQIPRVPQSVSGHHGASINAKMLGIDLLVGQPGLVLLKVSPEPFLVIQLGVIQKVNAVFVQKNSRESQSLSRGIGNMNGMVSNLKKVPDR